MAGVVYLVVLASYNKSIGVGIPQHMKHRVSVSAIGVLSILLSTFARTL